MNTKALRQKVLDLAIHGKLVPQNPNDESATVLLEKNRAEKAEKIKKGELKADKKDSFIFVGSDKRHYEQFADGTVKDIEDEIPFDVPKEWAWCRLGVLSETTDYIANGSFADTKANVKFYKDKNYALLVKTQDFNNNFTEDLTYTDEMGYNFLSKSHLFGGELLLSNIGASIGKALIVPKFDIPMAVAPNSIVVRTTNLLETHFLKSIMLSTYGQTALVKFTAGSAMPKFNKTQLRSLLIPLPSISVQKSIISIIDNIFEIIQSIDNNKDELEICIKQTKSKILDLAIHGKLVPQDPNDEPAEELLKRISTSDNRPYEKVDEEPFEIPDSWKWVKLSSICNKLVDGEHNPPKGIEEKTEYIMASSRNINYDRLDDLENVRYLSKEVFEIENNRTKTEKGDIFFTSVGTLGRSCIYSGDYNICFQRSVTILNTIINNQFLKYFFDSNFFQTYVIEHSTGTAQMGFYLKEMANSPITIPPMHEQARIVDKVSELFYQLDQIQNNLV
ncbi:MAG: restriction endonuclease subunit S [Treponema porcinum]|nr:restriction endonuclease subunit S [Treponema porcinum]